MSASKMASLPLIVGAVAFTGGLVALLTRSKNPAKANELHYFDGRGRAESIRLMLALAGIEYEDKRMVFGGPELPALKDTCRSAYGQVPFAVIDGIDMTQSIAIVRYIATTRGFLGKNVEESLLADIVSEGINDFFQKYGIVRYSQPESERPQKIAAWKSEGTLAKYLSCWEKMLAKNGSGYIVGSSITYADILLFNMLDWLALASNVGLWPVQGYPLLAAHYSKIAATPQIAKYIASRPAATW